MSRTCLALATVVAALALAPPANAALRPCKPVRDPYPNTRYADVDLTHIRTSGASCETARSVARRAHRKALEITPRDGFRHFTWHGWAVTGDLRSDHDHYVARTDGRQVRWHF